jgi:hypothetical protein
MNQRCPRNDATKMTSSSQEPAKTTAVSEPAKKPTEPHVNIIQVKRKPGPAPIPVTSQKPEVVEKEKTKDSKPSSSFNIKQKRSSRMILVCKFFQDLEFYM